MFDAAPMPSGVLIRELDLSDALVASAVHAVGLRAYAVEAELICFDGIPALSETLQEMTARPLRWLGAVTGEGTVAAFVAWRTDTGQHITRIDRVCADLPGSAGALPPACWTICWPRWPAQAK
ncbi:hypothetical protein ACWEKU_12295 [Streptomyces californicus]